MAKFDQASAYKNLTFHPDECPLLGMKLCGQCLVELVLPFGLCSAPLQTWLNGFWWSVKRFCQCCMLKSLIDHLQHTCKVAPQGRTFLRQMNNLLCAFHCDDLPIRLNQEIGGINLVAGAVLNLGWPQFLLYAHMGPSPRLPKSQRMKLALWAMELFLNSTGFLVPGQLHKVHYRLRIRNSSQLWYVAEYLRDPQWVSWRVKFLCNNQSVGAASLAPQGIFIFIYSFISSRKS